MSDDSKGREEVDRVFAAGFRRWAGRVRGRIALGRALTGASFGLLAGAAGSAGLWYARLGELRPLGAALGIAGAAAGLAYARSRRWKDEDVALYLDARLGSNEAIATAVELARAPEGQGGEARALVLSHAGEALASATPEKVRAPLFRRAQLLGLAGAAGIVALSLVPLPPAPARAEPPKGSDTVRMAELEGLEKVIELADLDARDEAQKKRLERLAEDAKRLREKLKDGMEKREAQSEIAKLRDQITAEKLSLGEGEERAGLESALGKMGENADLRKAEKALGDRDLVAFDEEMQKLANKLEKQDRERAKKTLEDAAKAAEKAGAKDVAKHLEEQRKKLDEKGKEAERLKELAEALGDGLGEEGKKSLEGMKSEGGEKEKRELARRMEEALGKLSEKERKQLAENLKKRAAQVGKEDEEDEGASPPSAEELRRQAEALRTPEGQKQLEEELRRMAEAPEPGSEEGERQKALAEAEKGAGEAERRLLPMMGEGGPGGKKAGGKPGGQAGDGKGGKDGEKGQGKAGPGGPSASGKPAGETAPLGGEGLRAHADARIHKAAPMPGTVVGRTASRPGETANRKGEGAIGSAAAAEVGAVERSDVPEEYREQVGRYFQAH